MNSSPESGKKRGKSHSASAPWEAKLPAVLRPCLNMHKQGLSRIQPARRPREERGPADVVELEDPRDEPLQSEAEAAVGD